MTTATKTYEVKTSFELYTVGERVVDGVNVDVNLKFENGNWSAEVGQPHTNMDKIFLERLGGPGAVDHWRQKVSDYFDDEEAIIDEFRENCPDDMYNELDKLGVF